MHWHENAAPLRSDGVQKDTCLSLWVCAGFAAECTAGFKNPTQLLSCKRAVLTSVPLQLLAVQPLLHTGSETSLCTATTFANVALSQMAHMLSLTASSVSRPTSEHSASCMTSLCVDSCVTRSDFLLVCSHCARHTHLPSRSAIKGRQRSSVRSGSQAHQAHAFRECLKLSTAQEVLALCISICSGTGT